MSLTAASPRLVHGLVPPTDEAVERSRLVGPMSAEALCRYVLRAVFASLMAGDECETLFALLDAALYDDTAEEKDAAK